MLVWRMHGRKAHNNSRCLAIWWAMVPTLLRLFGKYKHWLLRVLGWLKAITMLWLYRHRCK